MLAPLAFQPVVQQLLFGGRRHRCQHQRVVGGGELARNGRRGLSRPTLRGSLFVAFLAAAFFAGVFSAAFLRGLRQAFFGRRLLRRRFPAACTAPGVGSLVVRPVLERVEVELTHLGDAVGQVVVGPVVDRDRRVHHDVDGAGVERASSRGRR